MIKLLTQRQLQKILDDESVPTNAEKHIGALTAAERVPWAQARRRFFSSRINKKSLNAIEDVSLIVVKSNRWVNKIC